ncbi:MAG: GTPase HflX [Thermoplasmata archaeon]
MKEGSGKCDAKDVILITIRKDVSEIQELAETISYTITEVVYQNRSYPDRKYYVGEGKLCEIKKKIEEKNIETLIVNDPLEPTQIYYIEKETGAHVMDRTLLILEIFARNANSVEAKLQVELAKLQYEIPLMREYVHRYKTGEHSGAYAGGEYMVEQYYDLIKRRETKIRKELEKYRRARELQRKRRKELNFVTVALAGYTNAGKTTLLNALTDAGALADNRMFTTLSTLVRRLNMPKKNILVIDTIGFIDGLPLYIIDAFRATYEEICAADVVLVLVDGADKESEALRKMKVVQTQIIQYAARFITGERVSKKFLYVITKIDLATPDKLSRLTELIKLETGCIPFLVSALSFKGLDELIAGIEKHVEMYTKDEKAGRMKKVAYGMYE